MTQPCQTCLESCNNGHFWMFQMEGVLCTERMDQTGQKPLLWAFLPPVDRTMLRGRVPQPNNDQKMLTIFIDALASLFTQNRWVDISWPSGGFAKQFLLLH